MCVSAAGHCVVSALCSERGEKRGTIFLGGMG